MHKQEVVDGEFPPLSIDDTHVACRSQRDGCQALPADRLPTNLSRIHPEGETGNSHFCKWERFIEQTFRPSRPLIWFLASLLLLITGLFGYYFFTLL
ncbi:hypothetical protein B1694_12495 [Geobacillus zalihae]|nr:hypothetical protein B1694_12495 [Geobacillus zalihae]